MSMEAIINISIQGFGGLISLMILLCLSFFRPGRSRLDSLYVHLLFCNVLLQAFNILSWLADGRPGALSRCIVVATNFLLFVFSYLLIAAFMEYLTAFLAEQGAEGQYARSSVRTIAAVGIALVVLSQFNHMYYIVDAENVYHRGDWYWISNAIGILCETPAFWLLLRHRKRLSIKEQVMFWAYLLLPFAAVIPLMFIYGEFSIHLVTTFVVVCIYIFIQAEQSHVWSERELELEKGRTAIMLSQIQPHFLYNALLGIQDLCDSGDSRRTSKALEHFAYYLRGNLDSLSDPRLITFEKELGHVQDYLYLEKIRFEEKLNIIWKLGVTDFRLPSLTLQPIVENAVRHGITEKRGGGTLTIRSERLAEAVVITVMDDGVGFDVASAGENERTHVGIHNVRNRLATLCGGSLQVESKCGIGTSVKIILPQKEARGYVHNGG